MREVIDGVWMWSRLAQPQNYNFNGHLVVHDGGNVVIDPVEPAPDDLAELVRRGVAEIVLTNRNHTRAANVVREATGARTIIHDADAPHAREQGCVIDGLMALGQRCGPFVVVNAAGKSPGEVALYWPEREVLLVGDAIIGDPPGGVRLLPEEKLDDPAGLRASVRALTELEFDVLLVGDGEPILSGARAQVRDLAASFPED